MTTPQQPPQSGTVTSADTGRACPYCRFPLKEGIPMMCCGVCSAPHHADCWSDNGGCAVVACAGGPAQGAAQPDAPTVVVPPPSAAAAPAPPPSPAYAAAPVPPVAPRRDGSSVPWIAVGVVAVALIVAATTLVVVLSGRGGASAPTRTVVTIRQAADSSPAAETTTTDGSDAGSAPPAQAATVSAPIADDEANRQAIQHLLYQHHEDIVNGDYHGAWELMSVRKQAQKLREDGYGGWTAAQATLRPYLDPTNLHVDIQTLDPATGVARVMVTGMTWSKPGASCSQWSGITWVKYEHGAWRYDPGYSTTPEREAQWKNRFSELLGGSC